MPLIDEEGNVFGKINMIDLLVIIILILIFAVTVSLFNSYEEFTSQDNNKNNTDKDIRELPKLRLLLETTVSERNLKFITKGERDVSDGVMAVVEDVNITNTTDKSRKNLQIVLYIERPLITGDEYYFYYSGKQQILIDRTLVVKLRFIQLDTIIKDITFT